MGKREAAGGRGATFACGERMGMGEGRIREKHPPKSNWTKSAKVETAAGTELKREKEERRKEKGEGLNSIKTINRGSTESETPQLDTWWCSGGKGESPGAEWGPGVFRLRGERQFPCWEDTWERLCGSLKDKAPVDSGEQPHLLVLEQGH